MRWQSLLLLVVTGCTHQRQAEVASLCVDTPEPAGAPVPLRRLNRTHIEATVRSVLGVRETLALADERLFAFSSNISSPVDGNGVEIYSDFAARVVDKATLPRCTDEAACKSWLLNEVGLLLFRRPLSEEQFVRYSVLFANARATTASVQGAARWVLEAMLQSPAFLYLEEPVNADGKLDDYALASRLALMFWGQNPDWRLLEDAADGALRTSEGMRQQAKLMLADPRSAEGLAAFVGDWLRLDRLQELDARPDLAALGPEVLGALADEPGAFFRLVALDGGGLRELLTAARTAENDALATIYGRDILMSHDGQSVLDGTRRAGLLTLPGVMASLAHANVTSPTARGYAVLANLFCAPPPPPPAGLSVTLPQPKANVSTRERMQDHFANAACASCHQNMDGVGFAFEGFDALGRIRDQDGGRPIDARGEVRINGDVISVDGALDLSRALAERPEVGECFARQWMRYAGGVEPQADSCFVQRLGQLAVGENGLEEMMLALATSDYVRKGGQR